MARRKKQPTTPREIFDEMMKDDYLIEDRREYQADDLRKAYGLDEAGALELFELIQEVFRPSKKT